MTKQPHHPDWVIMGCIGKPFGIRGLSFIDSYTTPIDHIIDLLPLYDYHNPHDPIPLSIEALRVHGKRLIGRVESCDNPEQARAYTTHTLAIPRSQLPALENGHYLHDLIGLSIVDRHDNLIGQLVDIMDVSGCDVWVIEHKGQQYHLAYSDQAVLNIDLVRSVAIVDRHHVI